MNGVNIGSDCFLFGTGDIQQVPVEIDIAQNT